MLRVSIFKHQSDLTDQWLRQKVALGADAIDFGGDTDMPGVADQGYPNLDEVRALRKRVRSFGIDINRVTLPTLTQTYIDERAGADDELDNAAKALEVYGKARIPIARQRVIGDVFPQMMERYQTKHRGGYIARAETLVQGQHDIPSRAELERWWDRFCHAFERLTPIAEEYDIKLAVHPSDTPNVDTPFGGIGFHRIIDAFPAHRQEQVRAQFALVFEGVVTQALLPRAGGRGRVAACEILLATPATRALIREAKVHQLCSAMQAARKIGMQTLNDALFRLYVRRQVAFEDCIRVTSDPAGFRRMTGSSLPAGATQ